MPINILTIYLGFKKKWALSNFKEKIINLKLVSNPPPNTTFLAVAAIPICDPTEKSFRFKSLAELNGIGVKS